MSGRRGDRSRVQIPAARFSELWENFFGLKRFAKIAKFGKFLSSRGARLDDVQLVPEPSSYALLLLSGAASLWAFKRRKS